MIIEQIIKKNDFPKNVAEQFRRDCNKVPDLLNKFVDNEDAVKAWKVCILDDVVRTNPDKLTKVSRYLDNNPTKEAAFKVEFDGTVATRRGDFVDRTSFADDLKKAHDPDGSFANFGTQGMDPSNVPTNVYDDMVAEAAAPQFIDGIINSGSSIPQKIPTSQGYTLYKVVEKGEGGPSPFTPYWLKLDDLNTHGATSAFEQKLGLPVSSHGAKYDVYKIKVNPEETPNVFESTIANTVEGGYSTTGGATQSLVLDRAKWTDPELIPSLELFPPAN